MDENQEIVALFDRWKAALQTGDAERVAGCYAPDAVLLPTVSNRVRHDQEGIVDYFRHFLALHPVGRLNQSHVRSHGEIAINSGIYTFTLDGENGQRIEVPARYTFVYRREGDDWLIVEHHSSRMPEG